MGRWPSRSRWGKSCKLSQLRDLLIQHSSALRKLLELENEPSIPQAPIPSFPIKLVLLPEAEPRAQEFPFPRPPSPGWGEIEAQTHGKSDFNPPFPASQIGRTSSLRQPINGPASLALLAEGSLIIATNQGRGRAGLRSHPCRLPWSRCHGSTSVRAMPAFR